MIPANPVLGLGTHALQAIGTPRMVEAVAEAACAKPLEMQLPMFEVREGGTHVRVECVILLIACRVRRKEGQHLVGLREFGWRMRCLDRHVLHHVLGEKKVCDEVNLGRKTATPAPFPSGLMAGLMRSPP